jgi:hypothetical protein
MQNRGSKSFFRLMVAFALILAAAVLPAQQTLDPAEYLGASRASVSLPRAISAYYDYIDANDPLFFGLFDVRQTTRPYTIPSVDGPLGGSFLGVDGFIHVRFLKIEDFY